MVSKFGIYLGRGINQKGWEGGSLPKDILHIQKGFDYFEASIFSNKVNFLDTKRKGTN